MRGGQHSPSSPGFRKKAPAFLTPEKSGPISGAILLKEATKWKENQERQCKAPIRQPERLRVRSREQKVKVIQRPLFLLVKEHLPRQRVKSQASLKGES